MRVGVVSDTHGSLPPSLADAFAGVERILHAGDVGGRSIIDELETIAPVVAVRGNMDTGELEWRLFDTATLRLDGLRIMIVHKSEHARLPESGVDVLVSGHTHRASIERQGATLHVNPGSAGGQNRDGRGATAAIIDLSTDPPEARILEF